MDWKTFKVVSKKIYVRLKNHKSMPNLKGRSFLKKNCVKIQFLVVVDDVEVLDYMISCNMLIGGNMCIVTLHGKFIFEESI